MMLSSILAVALIWIPPESFTHWSQVDALMRSRADLKMTVALTPRMATPLAKAALAPWVTAGRVEIAARISGDPVLAIVAAHPAAPRPDDALELPAESKRELELRLGFPVSGFTPGAGALDSSLIGPLSAAGLRWVLTGSYGAAGSTWAAAGQTVFIPARVIASGSPLSGAGPMIVDESTLTDSAFIAALPSFYGGGSHPWVKMSELLPPADSALAPAAEIDAWPGWDPEAAAVADDPAARAAYKAYGNAAKAVERYTNSGTADLKILESATNALRRAQEARFFRAGALKTRGGLPLEMNARLLAVYKRLKSVAPDSLYDVRGRSDGAPGDQPTGVHAAFSANILAFENPAGSTAAVPSGAANSDPWLLRGLRVEWSIQRVVFRIQTSRIDAATAPPHAVYDLYIDLNHVLDAGEIHLFDGRGAFAQARDAWEFALSVNGKDAALYRSVTGDPEKIASLKTEVDPNRREIRVPIPREYLRGNPSRWGYILLSLAEDPARAGRSPAVPLAAPNASPILGVLGSIEVQKNLMDKPGSPKRIPAVRFDPTAR